MEQALMQVDVATHC